MLQVLNAAGYGRADSGLELNLVVNPSGAFLPPSQEGIEKRYLALVPDTGQAVPGVIETGLKGAAGRVKVVPAKGGAVYQTRVRPVSARGPWQLVQARIHRGFRHQIRVHLAGAGLPIAGDPLYGEGMPPGLGRLFLHASEILFTHPVTKEKLRIHSLLPKELREFCSD